MSPRHRWRNLLTAPFESALALSGVLTGVLWLIQPTTINASSIGMSLGGLMWAWVALYSGGSLLVIVGLTFVVLRLEIAGLLLFSVALLVDGIAIFNVHDVTSVFSEGAFFGLGLAAIARIYVVLHLMRQYAHVQPLSGSDRDRRMTDEPEGT